MKSSRLKAILLLLHMAQGGNLNLLGPSAWQPLQQIKGDASERRKKG